MNVFEGHILVQERIFIDFLADFNDWTSCKQVSQKWRSVLEQLEAMNANEIEEKMFQFNWFQAELRPQIIRSNEAVGSMCLSGNERWIFIELSNSRKLLAYDVRKARVIEEIPFRFSDESHCHVADSNERIIR